MSYHKPELNVKIDYSYDFAKWNVKNFDDALDLNIDFLKGNKSSSPYHAGPVYDVNTKKLVFIHKKNRILTLEGQSNECKTEEIPETLYVHITIDKNDNKKIENTFIKEKMIYSVKQKSYLSGYFENNQLGSFIEFLNKQGNKIGYYLYDFETNKEYESNFQDGEWLTKEKANDEEWDDTTHVYKNTELAYFLENIPNLVSFFIYSKNECDVNIDDIIYRNYNKSSNTKSPTKSPAKLTKKRSNKKN